MLIEPRLQTVQPLVLQPPVPGNNNFKTLITTDVQEVKLRLEKHSYLSLPPTLQDADGPDHDVARHKKANSSKQE